MDDNKPTTPFKAPAGEDYDFEDIKSELRTRIEDAHQFLTGEYSARWETAELYFAGGSDIPRTEGRSSVVKTEVMDVIRSLMPNVMRVIMQSKKPVAYIPTSMYSAKYVEQQAMWVMQLFLRNNGYRQLYNAVMESFKYGAGPLKTYWEEDTTPEFFTVTGIPASEVMAYSEEEDVEVLDVREVGKSRMVGTIQLYDVDFVRYFTNGKIKIEAVPIYEFFVERNATDLENFVHGHRREVAVYEAKALGLEYDDWESLDTENPEDANAAGAALIRRGYSPNKDSLNETDPTNKKILLTEAYCKYDLDGDGVSENYIFYLGGTSQVYLGHYRTGDVEFDVVTHDPMPHTIIGRSITEILKHPQDVSTSLLRAVVDNAHIANNPRAAADPNRVNFDDLMNNAIGAPIKTNGDSAIQLFDVPFTAGNLLPLLQWLEMQNQNKVGATKAAMGLDPDALQSTDKNAVMNTIQLAQGQIELMVRNIVETAMIGVFRKLLKLAGQHMDRRQVLRFKGEVIPIDVTNYDASLIAQPNVGLGTASPELQSQALSFIYQEQQKYLQQFGLDNPMVSLSQLYNTLEDLAELGGISNLSRYFNFVDKSVEAAIAAKMAEQAKAAAEEAMRNKPMDPTAALLEVEKGKREADRATKILEARQKTEELTLTALIEEEKAELKRDELALKRFTELLRAGTDKAKAAQTQASMTDDRKINFKPASPDRSGVAGDAQPVGE